MHLCIVIRLGLRDKNREKMRESIADNGVTAGPVTDSHSNHSSE